MYKKYIKITLSILLILFLSGCKKAKNSESEKTGFNDLLYKTIEFSDDFLAKDYKIQKGVELPNIYKIIKKEKQIINGVKTLYFKIEIPYSLRDQQLSIFMELFSNKYMDKEDAIEIQASHFGISEWSGVVAEYRAKRDTKTLQILTDYKDYLSREELEKRGITHPLLEMDYQTVFLILKERKNRDWRGVFIKKHSLTNDYLNQVISFTEKYYQKKFPK